MLVAVRHAVDYGHVEVIVVQVLPADDEGALASHTVVETRLALAALRVSWQVAGELKHTT